MRIAVVGSGAMGGLYGAFLARAGFDVHFLMRRDYAAVKSCGLTVKSCQGDFHQVVFLNGVRPDGNQPFFAEHPTDTAACAERAAALFEYLLYFGAGAV